MFLALGLEVAGTPGKTPAGTPARGGRGTATFPVVSSVTAGGYAENWGVTSGMKIIEVRGKGGGEGGRSYAFHRCLVCALIFPKLHAMAENKSRRRRFRRWTCGALIGHKKTLMLQSRCTVLSQFKRLACAPHFRALPASFPRP